MAYNRDQASPSASMPYNLLQHDPAKSLAGLAEGLEPSLAAEEELDDYEQVLAGIQRYTLSRSMLTHPWQAPAVLEPFTGAYCCACYTSRCPKLAGTNPIVYHIDTSKGILGDALCLPVRLSLLQLEFGNVDFLDTHQLRQRLSDNASRVRTRVQQVTCHALC